MHERSHKFWLMTRDLAADEIEGFMNEVRSLPHPMFLRPLVNRNAAQRQATFQRGRDAFVPGMN